MTSPYYLKWQNICIAVALIKIPALVVFLTVNLFQDGKGKEAVPVIRLNVIRLLAELCVCLKKWEVVDMILPLFIEHLEEGDASSPSSLRLRVWNFVSYSFIYFSLEILVCVSCNFSL